METEVTPIIQAIQETIEKHGATEVVLSDMGKSRLAYPMKHIRYGYFYILQFSAEATAMKEMGNRVRLISNILRLVVRSYNPKTQTVDMTKLSLTPLANVVSNEEVAPPARETRREPMAAKPMVEAEVVKTVEPVVNNVSMEEIEEKLDQLLEKDLEKV